MRKFFLGVFAMASMLLATGCSNEDSLMESNQQNATFQIHLEGAGAGSRALADGTTVGAGSKVDKVYYAVYETEEDECLVTGFEEITRLSDGQMGGSVNIRLVNGLKFDIVFFAHSSENSAFEIPADGDLRNLTFKTTGLNANQDAYDAFYHAELAYQTNTNSSTKVYLKRPLAQLNVATTADDLVNAAKLNAKVTKSKIVLKGVPTSFNARTGVASGSDNVEVTFAQSPILEQADNTNETLTCKINSVDETFNYLAMTYVLANEKSALYDSEFEFYRADGDCVSKHSIPNVPLQRNYRTNITGNILTQQENFSITLDTDFGEDDSNAHNVDANDITVASVDELNNLLAEKAKATDKELILNVKGLSGTQEVAITIPDGATVSSITLNLLDLGSTTTKFSVSDDDSDYYTGDVVIGLSNDADLTSTGTTIYLPGSHVRLEGGKYGTINATTSSTTLVVSGGTIVGKLIVDSGNVAILKNGTVTEIGKGENNNSKVIVSVEPGATLTNVPTDSNITVETTLGDTDEWVLTENVELVGSLNVASGKALTIDLNGYTLSQSKACTASYQMINNRGTLTIKDTKGNGKISFKDTSNGDPNFGWGSYTIRNEGTLVVENGMIEHLGEQNQGNGQPTVHMYCAIFQYSGSTTIDGGTISTPTYRSARLWKGEMIINDGTFDGQLWVQAVDNSAKLTINGGSFSPNGNDESSVFISNASYDVEFSVTGGTFETKIGCSHEAKLAGSVTGGTFKFDPSAFVNSDYAVVENNGVWTIETKKPVAKIGEEKYTTLQKAVNAVQDGGTITLIANETFTNNNRTVLNGYYEGLYYEGDKSFTIDLGGYTIGQNDSAVNDYLMLFKNGGSKANVINFKNGTIDAGTTAYCAICTSGGSTQQITINLEDIKIIGGNSNGDVIKVRGGTVLNVKDGTEIIGQDSYLGIESYASVTNIYDGAKIYQNGQTSYNGCLIGVSGGGTVNVYGGYGKGVKGCLIAMTSGGTINVYGGEWIANTDGTYANGNASVLIAQSNKQYTTSVGNSIVNVTGGTFKGGYNCYGDAEGDAQINISGGSFNADPSEYLAEGYKAEENDGEWTIAIAPAAKIGETEYASLQEAFNAGGEITLLRNVTLAETAVLEEGKTVVLDLNSKTISAVDKNTIKNNGGILTIKNGTVTRTGDVVGYSVNNASGEITVIDATIKRGLYTSGNKMTATNANISHEQSSRHAIYAWNCEVTINSGTFHNDNAGNATLMASGSSIVTINGGTFSIANGTSTLGYTSSMMDQNNTAQVTVKGGLFNGGFRINSADTKLTIEGGEFNTNNGSAFSDYNGTKVVKGGKFTDEGARTWAKKYLAGGYTMNENGEVVTEKAE